MFLENQPGGGQLGAGGFRHLQVDPVCPAMGFATIAGADYVVDYGGDNDNVLLAADGATISEISVDAAGGADCAIAAFELSYKTTGGAAFETYEPRETEPFVFDAVTGALTVVANAPFAYTLKLTATTANGETTESGEFQVTSSCGISASKSSFDIAIPDQSEYVIDGNQATLGIPYVGHSADDCKASQYSIYIKDDSDPGNVVYSEHPDFETTYTDLASEEKVQFKIIDSKSLLRADYEYLLAITTRDGTLVVDTSRTYALSVICGAATMQVSAIEAESSAVIDGAQPALSFPAFGTKSTDCPITQYQIISEVSGSDHTVSSDFDQGWTEDSGAITFKIEDSLKAAKATYTYYVKAFNDGDSTVTSSSYTFAVVCGGATIDPSAIDAEKEYVIDGNVPELAFPAYGTHSDDCPITRYELLSDGSAVSADFAGTNTVSSSEVTVSLVESKATIKADYTYYVKAYNEGSDGVEGELIGEARVFKVICGSATYTPSAIDPSDYEIDNN